MQNNKNTSIQIKNEQEWVCPGWRVQCFYHFDHTEHYIGGDSFNKDKICASSFYVTLFYKIHKSFRIVRSNLKRIRSLTPLRYGECGSSHHSEHADSFRKKQRELYKMSVIFGKEFKDKTISSSCNTIRWEHLKYVTWARPEIQEIYSSHLFTNL
jgi:hypothetical protein